MTRFTGARRSCCLRRLLYPEQCRPGLPAPSKEFLPGIQSSRFSALLWFEDDAHANLRRTAEYLSERIESAQVGQRWNTLVASWKRGLADIDLMSFPPEGQSDNLQNDTYDREPRLRTACRFNIATGFVPF